MGGKEGGLFIYFVVFVSAITFYSVILFLSFSFMHIGMLLFIYIVCLLLLCGHLCIHTLKKMWLEILQSYVYFSFLPIK